MVFEAIFLALFGFLLQSSMSRCVAVIIGLYAILVAFLTIAAKAGVYRGTGGTNVVLAAILLYTAWRGVYAAVLYQRSRNARASVKNVVILTVLSLALTAVIGLVIIVVAIASGYGTRLRRECEMVVRESHPTSTSRELYVRQCIDDRAKSAR